jgi:3-oxoacyl-[acyl-carrier protein] reductase
VDLGIRDRMVVVASADAADGDACAALLRAEGANVISVGDLDDAGPMVADLDRVDGVVMYLPNVASRTLGDATVDDLYDSWASVQAVAAAFTAAVPSMSRNGWGRLVSVTTGSVKWLSDDSDELGTLAGLGVLGLHKAAVADIASAGISTNAVLRGNTSDPGEVAAAVAFLLSEDAAYLQGVTISLDGANSPAMY